MNPRVVIGLCCASVAILSGCGGGATSAGTPEVREASYGPVSTRSVGGVSEPVVMSGGPATVMGVFGASFLNVTVNLPSPTPETDQAWDYSVPISVAAFARAGYFDLSNNQTYVPYPAPSSFAGMLFTAFTTNGQSILSGEQDEAGNLQIFSTTLDGSARTKLTTGGAVKVTPHQSTLTGQICFLNGNDIWIMNSNGTGGVNLTNTPGILESMPKFNAAGTKIGFVRNSGVSDEFWEMDTNGANPAFVASGNVLGFDYHPTDPVVALAVASGTFRFIQLIGRDSGVINGIVNENSPVLYEGISFSPSGSYLCTRRYDGANYWLSIFNLMTRTRTDVAVVGPQTLVGEWAPLPRKKFFINPTAATLHTNAAGFMFGSASTTFTSMLAFDAQTRNTVDIDPHPAGPSSLSYSATITAADKLTMLRYANGMITPRVTIIDPNTVSTHAQGALATFSSSTGKVQSVITFTRSRDASKPATTRSGNTIKFNHDFLAAYDENGKLIKSAPKDVTQNIETGAISYR